MGLSTGKALGPGTLKPLESAVHHTSFPGSLGKTDFFILADM